MIRWREAYERLTHGNAAEFKAAFGGLLPMSAFRFLTYSQRFEGVAASASVGTLGTQTGPILQTFPAGAIILGITASAIQAQVTTGTFTYAPSLTPGRRDLFALSMQYTNNELITPGGLTMAEALLGSGTDTIFPGKELMMPPNQGILCGVASLTVAPTLTVHVAYHSMVPRSAG